MKSTIKDVAKKAGVSIATVSFVINNSKQISASTRNRVLKAIKLLNYHPSSSARDLATGKTGNLGFILTDDHFLRTEPFYTRIFLGTEFEARVEGYYVLLSTIKRDFNDSDNLPRFVVNRNVDGIIVAGKVPDCFINKLCSYNLPTVFVDYIPPKNNCPQVLIDNIQGALMATNHLISLGHKNIAFIGGGPGHPSWVDRLEGYKQALESAGISVRNNLIISNDDYQGRQNGYNSAKKLFSKKNNITAVFAANDAMAIGVMNYLTENGYKIPNDVSIIGFDDIEADLMLNPTLSTIRVPKLELGSEALKLLVNSIKSKKTFSKKILIPVELIKRESTASLKLK